MQQDKALSHDVLASGVSWLDFVDILRDPEATNAVRRFENYRDYGLLLATRSDTTSSESGRVRLRRHFGWVWWITASPHVYSYCCHQ